ncbi:MAG: hypothetical protein NVS3B3_16500 [Aquirhabdus sp.]
MRPINVLFKKYPPDGKWGGCCSDPELTESGEIEMNIAWVEEHIYRPKKRNILAIYMHECAHRLAPGHGHDAVFFALNLMMHLRADAAESNIWHSIKLYDIQDESDLVAAFDWSYRIAHEYASSKKTCEECAIIFSEKYEIWKKWMSSADQRESESKFKWTALSQRVDELKYQRWGFLMVGASIGFVLTGWFAYLLSSRIHS